MHLIRQFVWLLSICGVAIALFAGQLAVAQQNGDAQEAAQLSGAQQNGLEQIDPEIPAIDMDALNLQVRLGWQALMQGQLAAATTALEAALDIDPMSPDALVLMGQVNRQQKKLKSAFDYFTTALAVDPLHARALAQLGILYLDVGRVDKANPYLQQLVEICPFGCAARRQLAHAIAKAGGNSVEPDAAGTAPAQD